MSLRSDQSAAGPGPAESCQVSLLVPHPSRVAVLVAVTEPSTQPRLPTARLNSREPSLAEILAAIDVVDTATTPVLRLVSTSATDEEDGESSEVALLVELEAAATEPPAGWTWLDLNEAVIARLVPENSRGAVAAWVHERTVGWSPLRPPWSRAGWFTRASAWMIDQLAADGRPVSGMPRQHQLWDVSVVLRASTAGGDVFFKCSPEIFRHEAVATRALAELTPDLVPEVVAVDRARGWMLMRDFSAAELGEQDPSLWHHGLVAHAGIQQAWLGRTDELVALGVPVRALPDLAAQVEATTEDTLLLGRMPGDVREQWLATVATFVESCRRLDELGPGPTLVHGDLHPWNVAHGPATTRVFDWTDAAVSHPFVDLATYVFRSDDTAVRRRLVAAYVDAWSSVGSAKSLSEAASLGLVVGALYQVQTYRALLPTLANHGADAGLADADLSWIKRSLTWHEHGLGSPA